MKRALLATLLLAACSSSDDDNGVAGQLSGTLYVQAYDNNVHAIDLATGTDTTLGQGDAPEKTAGGFLCVEGSNLVEGDPTLQTYRHIDDGNGDINSVFSTGFTYPRLSPDGSKVAYTTISLGKIVVVDFHSGAQLAVIDGPDHQKQYGRVSWTPDGRLVIGDAYNDGIFISDAAFSNNLTRIAPELENTRFPIVSHDGKSIAYQHDRQIWKMNLDGSNKVQIELADPTGVDGDSKLPFWSPDDTFLYWAGSGGDVVFHSLTPADPNISLFATFPDLPNKDTILLGQQGMDWVK